MQIEPMNKVLDGLFGESNVYLVPKYQRAYSWQRDNVDEFCDDLWELYLKAKAGEPTEHFLGSFVCISLPWKALQDKREYQLVDGQQRLSTTCLLASRIIRRMESLSNDDIKLSVYEKVKKIKKKYICYYPEENDKYECTRVQLSEKDRLFYQELILNYAAPYKPGESPISHKLLSDAAGVMDNWLEKFKGSDDIATVDNLYLLFKVFSSSCRIINILMSKQSDAYKIFQVINDRGRSLSAADLLRATTLGMMEEAGASAADIEGAENCWNKITTGGDRAADSVLEAHYVSRKAKKMQKSAIYDLFISEFFYGRTTTEIIAEIEDILNSKIKIDMIRDGEWPYQSSAYTPYQKNKLNVIIKLFKHTQCVPLLLAASRYKEKKFYQLVFLIEKFFFRFKIVSDRRFDPAAKAYYALIGEINKMGGMYKLQAFISELSTIIVERSPADDVVGFVRNKAFVVNGDNKLIKFILSSIEEGWIWAEKGYVQGIKGAFKYHATDIVSNQSNLSIEHIYPVMAKVKQQELESEKHHIGNLCLLLSKENSLLGDSCFEQKREAYVGSCFNITRCISTSEAWGAQEIKAHMERIQKRAVKIFSI